MVSVKKLFAVVGVISVAVYVAKRRKQETTTYTVLPATIGHKYIRDNGYWEEFILEIGDYQFQVPEDMYDKAHIGDSTALKYCYDNGKLLKAQLGGIEGTLI